MALYERGAKLRAHCEKRLREAEERVEKITLAANGEVGSTPVEGL
ncbi:exodeoxyribonuclease VII small subunit [Streptomyces sp. P9(2023)]